MEYLMYNDVDTGRYVYLIEVEGKPCPFYFHDTKLSRQYAAYHVIKKDLGNARGAFAELDNNRDQSPIVRLSLLFAAIVLYGKCYSEAKGRKVSLNNKMVLKDLDSRFHQIHNHLIHIRNHYVAHSGEGDYEQYPVSLNLSPDVSNKAILGYMINGIQQVHHEPYLKNYIELIDRVTDYASDMIAKVEAKLNVELSELNIESIYAASRTPVREHCAPISGNVKFP